MALRQPKHEPEIAGARGAEGYVARPRVCNMGEPEDGTPAPPPAGVRRRRTLRVDVGAISDFPEGRSVGVMASGREVAVVRWRGRIYAIRNVCPHQSEALVGGVVRSRITGAEARDELRVDDDDPVIVCPWHAWHFSLRTGVCVTDPSLRARSYEVSVEDGRVIVQMGSR
jgi:nitrite reductase/ring-hydroxylating ferredoxin subunit